MLSYIFFSPLGSELEPKGPHVWLQLGESAAVQQFKL